MSSGGSTSRIVSAGGGVNGLALLSGGKLIDNGLVLVAGTHTFAGALSGSGSLSEVGPGSLILSGAGSAFSGKAVISGGTIELATSGAIGTGSVVFAGAGSATLQIDAADAPAAGGTFANTISNFSGANDFIDLRSIAFVSGASATVSASTLVLSDGGHTYKFKLAGSIGGAFPVTSDGHGGTLIDPHVAGFAQTMAGFAQTMAGFAGRTGRAGPPGSSGTASGLGPLINAVRLEAPITVDRRARGGGTKRLVSD